MPAAPPVPTRTLQVLRLAAGIYTLLLGWLLLVPDPLALFGVAGAAAEEAIDWSFSGAVQHIGAFAVLGGLWCLSASDQRGRSTAALLSAVFGGSTELLQLLVPTRFCDWYDLLANLIGIALGWAAARAVEHIAPPGLLRRVPPHGWEPPLVSPGAVSAPPSAEFHQ